MRVKTKKVLNTTKYSILFLCLFVSNLALAAAPNVISVELNNPLRVDSIEDLLEALLTVVIVLATPIIVFFIMYAGFLYVTARGNAEQIKQATNALTYAVIGGVMIVGAVAIATIIKNLVTNF